MMRAKVYEQSLTIPTYAVGSPEKNPMFFEKRVYQGSSGKVYPNPVVEKISDSKQDQVYKAVILENDYIYVIVLPELGGRIYTAIDKTNDYDFVYHNKVIKPALVGLLGPWISGGIEFNWPQHHRPTTYMGVNYHIKTSDDSVSVFVGETEAMFGLKHTTEIKIYNDSSYIEIATQVYNNGELPQTFLWWANPAYKVNDDTITVMPQDVTAVMDHGKRAVSTFPIATGEYYKMDYSSGVDISCYKNIPVPTSFMAHKSEFDFIGGYDYGKQAGLLHVANHHVSPGKKQWTWGCGDFGIAWDRNLTDEDGAYVELMTGCFTDNQPDFTFIAPHERKEFTQYFMPYHNIGRILNADKNLCFGVENGVLRLYSQTKIDCRVSVVESGKSLYNGKLSLVAAQTVELAHCSNEIEVNITYDGGSLSYSPSMVKKFDIPQAATACPIPTECESCEDLYIYGSHIEQYRHATRLPEDYYLEGLKRNSDDIRLNNAYGALLMRLGRVEESIPYLDKAIDKLCSKNTNPKDTEAYFNAAMARIYLGRYDEAYDLLYRCIWSDNKAKAYYYIALIDIYRGNINLCEEHLNKGLTYCGTDTRAINTLGNVLSARGKVAEAEVCYNNCLAIDNLNVMARYELGDMSNLASVSASEIRIVAGYYFDEKRYDRAENMLNDWAKCGGISDYMTNLYTAYAELMQGKAVSEYAAKLDSAIENTVSFASSLLDLKVLNYMASNAPHYTIFYQLGNLHYDKRNYKLAADNWLQAREMNPTFPTVKRNLAIYYYNKAADSDKALECMEQAYSMDKSDSRILLELFQLYNLTDKSYKDKFNLLQDNISVVEKRDDLYIDYINLLVQDGKYAMAYNLIMSRHFHPWEGGEGKVTKLYKQCLSALAKAKEKEGDYVGAVALLESCFTFPQNLGEGKLILDYDNDTCFELGELATKFGKLDDAARYYNMAVRGKIAVADDMYYNDNPIEYIYYAARAYKRLGNVAEVDRIKSAFMKYYNDHINKKATIDYFAVSLPDMLIWNVDIDKKNIEFCSKLKELAETL